MRFSANNTVKYFLQILIVSFKFAGEAPRQKWPRSKQLDRTSPQKTPSSGQPHQNTPSGQPLKTPKSGQPLKTAQCNKCQENSSVENRNRKLDIHRISTAPIKTKSW